MGRWVMRKRTDGTQFTSSAKEIGTGSNSVRVVDSFTDMSFSASTYISQHMWGYYTLRKKTREQGNWRDMAFQDVSRSIYLLIRRTRLGKVRAQLPLSGYAENG